MSMAAARRPSASHDSAGEEPAGGSITSTGIGFDKIYWMVDQQTFSRWSTLRYLRQFQVQLTQASRHVDDKAHSPGLFLR
ncbi:MAG: hypothetical protein JSV37_13475, partial [Anaerolineaceae bacterium]